MRTRYIVVGLTTLCLLGGAPAPNAKPLRPVRTYYLVQTGEAPCSGDTVLRLTPSSENHGQCYPSSAGAQNEVVENLPVTCRPARPDGYCGATAYDALEGVPFRLNASRPITGTIHVGSIDFEDGVPGLGAGAATTNIALTARIGGKYRVLGLYSADYVVTPLQKVYEIAFEMELDAAFHKATATSLTLHLWNSGATAGHGVYKPDVSNVVVPVWR